MFTWGMFALTAFLFLIGVMDVIPTSGMTPLQEIRLHNANYCIGAKWAQSALTVIWAFIYSLTIGAMAFAILGETSSSALRAHTSALANATQSIMGIIMNFAIPYMINPDAGNLKGKVGFIFGALGMLGAAWAWFYVPELKGRTVEEIDAMFQARVPPRKMGSHISSTSSDELSR